MTSIRLVLAFSLIIALLVLTSQSLPTSAVDDGGVLIPSRGSVLLQSQPVKAGEKVADSTEEDGLSSSTFQPRKLGVHIKKARRGGLARSAGGRTSSSAGPTPLSSFHIASILGSSLFLGLILL